MKKKGATTAIPRVPPEGVNGTRKMWQLSSTYSNEAESRLLKYGNAGNWRPKMSPPFDWVHARWGNIVAGLHFSA
jgi:hypothetical protein